MRETGGLKDTVEPFTMSTKAAELVSPSQTTTLSEMLDTVRYAKYIYDAHKSVNGTKIIDRAFMAADFSLAAVCRQHQELYDWLIGYY